MRFTLFRTLIGSSLLLVVCALSACGKTGALYLPDTSPAGTAAQPAAKPDTPPSPNKSQ